MEITINPTIADYYNVDPNELVVTDTDIELRTSALYTCSALIIMSANKRLLTHVTATSSSHEIATAIEEHFETEPPDIQAYLVPGDQGPDSTKFSRDVITDAVTTLGLGGKLKELSLYTSSDKELVISANGHIFEDAGRFPLNKRIAALLNDETLGLPSPA